MTDILNLLAYLVYGDNEIEIKEENNESVQRIQKGHDLSRLPI